LRAYVSHIGIHLLLICLMFLLIVVVVNPGMFAEIPMPDMNVIQTFKTMLISIVLEAIPFILLGVLVSSFMHVYISDQWMSRFLPKNPVLGIIFACVLGILFPVCECGMIPVIRRLIAKGMSLYIGVVFMLVGPIVNPIVFAATYTAFRTRPEMLYARMGLALFVGILIGLFIYFFVKKDQMKYSSATNYDSTFTEGSIHQHSHGGSKLISTLEHAGSEFFEMGKYLMLGSFLTAAIQSFIPRGDLVDIGQGSISSHLFMMGFAYVLSLCSTSDAFVASSFANTFSMGSLLTFLVFGPMLDFKSTFMMLSVFKIRFVILLMSLIISFVLLGAILVEHFYFTS
jgi:uncharacterized membrane protein YraQ (UPF0718 family)